ncbi:MAG: hypothetical protein ACREFA_17210, partial [Stellaceae bacterium]
MIDKIIENETVTGQPADERVVPTVSASARPVAGATGINNPEPGTNIHETAQLIASDKVEGTNVRRTNGDKLGVIRRVMI